MTNIWFKRRGWLSGQVTRQQGKVYRTTISGRISASRTEKSHDESKETTNEEAEDKWNPFLIRRLS
jgi:hypothetical protein